MLSRVLAYNVALTGMLALTAPSASAADLYRTTTGGYKDGGALPAGTWQGFYIGANLGYGWAAGDKQTSYADVFSTAANTFPAYARSPAVDASGAFAGAQIGFNVQRDSFVFGVEADLQGAGLGDSVTGVGYGSKRSVDWFGTARGRAGYALDRTLIYVTGGLAFGGVQDRYNFVSQSGLAFPFKRDSTEAGYVIGGGVEYKLSSSWSVKGEYQYIDFGANKFDGSLNGLAGAPLAPFTQRVSTSDIDSDFHTVRVGLNYRFQDGYEPLK